MEVRSIERKIIKLVKRIEKIKKEIRLETDDLEVDFLNDEINEIEEKIAKINFTIPNNWEEENKKFNNIVSILNKTKLNYNKTVDSSYNQISDFIKKFQNVDKLHSIYELYDKSTSNHEKTIQLNIPLGFYTNDTLPDAFSNVENYNVVDQLDTPINSNELLTIVPTVIKLPKPGLSIGAIKK